MIIVCGEALFDVFSDDGATAGERDAIALTARIGGSPYNLAIGLARMGAQSAFFGGLASDGFGRKLAATLTREGVDIEYAPRPRAATALVMVDVDAAGVPAYTLYGEATAERCVTEEDLLRVPQRAAAIHVGSYCMVVEPVASTLRALVERQCGHSLIAFDPNVRLTIQPRRDVWTQAIAWMLPRTDLLKISEEDIAHVYPGMAPEEFIDTALRAGVALVVVTRGDAGVVAGARHLPAVVLPAARTTVIDTVGAGDTFQAALLSWLSRRGLLTRSALASLDTDTLKAALSFAGRAAAITCSRRGADLPTWEEVQSTG